MLDVDTNEREVFSANFACPVSGFAIEGARTKAFFFFNSPFGACQNCEGLGEKIFLTQELLIPDKKNYQYTRELDPTLEKRNK